MHDLYCRISPEEFDKAVHGGLPDDLPVLKEGGDLHIFVKPNATQAGRAAAVLTFTVQLPDGRLARAQCVTTANLLHTVGRMIEGWQQGGHI